MKTHIRRKQNKNSTTKHKTIRQDPNKKNLNRDITFKQIALQYVQEACSLTNLSPASLLWDIGKRYSPRCDAVERGVPSRTILFAYKNFIEKWNKILKSYLQPLKLKVDSSS